MNANQISFSGGNWWPECGVYGDANGVYTWAFDGKSLKLVLVADSCSARTLLLLTRPLTPALLN